MNTEIIMCGCVLGLVLADIILGYGAAWKNSELSSSIMREGLFKKAGSVALMLIAVAIGHAGVHVGIDSIVCDTVSAGVCLMLAIMELTSCVENCCKLNPDLPVAKVFALFGLSDDLQCDITKDSNDECIPD